MAEIEYSLDQIEVEYGEDIEEQTEEEIAVTTNKDGTVSFVKIPTVNIHDISYHNRTCAPWISTEVFVQGCYKNCQGCFNQVLRKLDIFNHVVKGKELAQMLIETVPYKCVTYSGGEPMIYAEALAETAKILRENGFIQVCYTGYLAEETPYLFKGAREFISQLDILVDGMFIHQLLTPIKRDFDFVGSSNQRIIDVQESLAANHILFWDTNKNQIIKDREIYKNNVEVHDND